MADSEGGDFEVYNQGAGAVEEAIASIETIRAGRPTQVDAEPEPRPQPSKQ